jgi:hypothetical protein
VSLGVLYSKFKGPGGLLGAAHRSALERLDRCLSESFSGETAEAQFASLWRGLSQGFLEHDRALLAFERWRGELGLPDDRSSQLPTLVDFIAKQQQAGVVRGSNAGAVAAIVWSIFIAAFNAKVVSLSEAQEMAWAAIRISSQQASPPSSPKPKRPSRDSYQDRILRSLRQRRATETEVRFRLDDQRLTADEFLSLATHVAARNPPKEQVLRSLRWSYNVTAWDEGRLVGCIRVATDYHRFAAVVDLVVARGYRKEGIGTRLLQLAWEHSPVPPAVHAPQGMKTFFERSHFVKRGAWYARRRPRPPANPWLRWGCD